MRVLVVEDEKKTASFIRKALQAKGIAADVCQQCNDVLAATSATPFPPEALPRVYNRFFRADPAHSPAADGCGLGLSIVQWITLVHSGTITISSETGVKTTANVRLPLAEAKEANA